MSVANTLAYYDTATITEVRSFIVQAPGSLADNCNRKKFYSTGPRKPTRVEPLRRLILMVGY
jgi:hypothetical protein